MFAQRLKELIIEKNLTQKQLANETKIPTTSINNWINGKVEPNSKQLIVLANFFRCTTDMLLGRENDYGLVEIKNELTPFQKKLIAVMNKLTTEDQYQVLGFAQALAR